MTNKYCSNINCGRILINVGNNNLCQTCQREKQWKSQNESGVPVPIEHQKELPSANSNNLRETVIPREKQPKMLGEGNTKKIEEQTTQNMRKDREKKTEENTSRDIIKTEKKNLHETASEEQTGSNIMKKTAPDITPKEMKDSPKLEIIEKGLIQPEVYSKQYTTSDLVPSPSMILIDSSAEQLFALLKGLTHDKPAHDIKRVECHVAESAAKVAAEIRGLLKLKLDVLQFTRGLKNE